jgi:hypothetical protein
MRFKLTSLLFFFLTFLFGLFSPVFAQTVDAVQLTGTVTNQSGSGIENVSITATAPGGSTTLFGPSITLSNGSYQLEVDPGTYDIHFNPPVESGFSSAIAVNQSITANKTLNFVLVAVGAPLTFSGHLYDALGNPLQFQQVTLSNSNGGGTATTDASGFYSIPQLSSGNYQLTLRSSGSRDAQHNVPLNYVISTNFSLTQATVLDITFPASMQVVHVQDSAGNPINNINVYTSTANTTIPLGGGLFASGTVTGADFSNTSGDAEIWLFPSTFNFTAEIPSGSGLPFSSTTISNITVTGVNDPIQTITLQSAFTLSGRIYDALGNPLRNQRVSLSSSAGGGTATTNATGFYQIQNMSTGNYTLNVESSGARADQHNAPVRYHLHMPYSLNQNSVLDITLPANKFVMHVRDAFGNGVNNVNVFTSTESTNVSLGNGLNATGTVTGAALTNTSGDADIWLFPATFDFTAEAPSGSSFSNTTISDIVVAGDPQEEEIILQQQVTLSGHIYDSLGNPLRNQEVSLGNATTGSSSTTDPAGFYQIQHVPAGNYSLILRSSGSGADQHNVPRFYVLQTNYVLSQNSVLDITIPANKVDVRVQDPLGDPVSNVNVFTSTENINVSVGNGINLSGSVATGELTNASGDADLWLFPGTFDFFAQPPSGSSYTQFALNNVAVTGDQSIVISLQFAATPTPTNTPTPTPVPNVAPVVGVITASVNPVAVNTSTTATASFTDANISDTHTAVWNWGDGLTSTGTVTENNGSGSVSGNHVYLAAGVYEVTLTVTDNQNAQGTSTYQFISVYDPSLGWATGSKEFTTPAGSVSGDPSATGKTDFGFQVKYQHGDIVPSGKNVELTFAQGNIDFVSTSYLWLAINGTKATFKANGTLNGVSGYTILVSAIDLGSNNGLVRFQIKDSSNMVIYDTQPGAADTADPTTPVSKGQIKVQ